MKKLTAPKGGEVCSYCNKYIQYGKVYWWVNKEVKEVFSNAMSSANSYIACNICYTKMCKGETVGLYNA